jgi:hypothetical protein
MTLFPIAIGRRQLTDIFAAGSWGYVCERDKPLLRLRQLSPHAGDRRLVIRIMSKLEAYRTPKSLRPEAFPDRIGNLFRDEDEIPAWELPTQPNYAG